MSTHNPPHVFQIGEKVISIVGMTNEVWEVSDLDWVDGIAGLVSSDGETSADEIKNLRPADADQLAAFESALAEFSSDFDEYMATLTPAVETDPATVQAEVISALEAELEKTRGLLADARAAANEYCKLAASNAKRADTLQAYIDQRGKF